ncbi:MAG TPA: GIY-YIG nuclease family protein [Arenimonas sp.]|uniref:GIY-YIG nuclease family protein n=1 Tax=Arenimonas sp. TaxID=1872635 RepID=UPI002D7F3A16|nr:GIY-YIG nuclease family protein [Arenimonas sp.]HEU0153181.1 GIY-YIG nuclease family protein [Arenimonas sp.]
MLPPKQALAAAESTRKWWACPGVVYFLGVGDPIVAVKIGMLAITERLTLASAVRRRLSQIQTSNHEPIHVLGLIHFSGSDFPTRDAEIRERELHLEFEHLGRFKAGTKGAEWFSSSPELLRRIAEVSKAPEELGVERCIAVQSGRQ